MWHEAKKTERKVHAYMDAAKVRAEKKAAWFASMRGDPVQSLRLTGTGCKFHHDISVYRATENHEGLVAWNGKADHLIDRFDGRALLDYIREYDPRLRTPREKTEEEQELDEVCNYERYKDLIKLRRKGLSDEAGLEEVEDTIVAKAAAPAKDKEKASGGKQTYAKIGFSYDGSNQFQDAEDDLLEASAQGSDESSSDDSEDEKIEQLAEGYGVEDYHRLVRIDKKAREDARAAKEATEPGQKKLNRKERKKLGLLNNDKTKFPRDHTRLERRSSPSYDPAPTRRRRSRSRSRSPHHRHRSRSDRDPPKTEFITEFEGSLAALPLGPPPAPPPERLSRSGNLTLSYFRLEVTNGLVDGGRLNPLSDDSFCIQSLGLPKQSADSWKRRPYYVCRDITAFPASSLVSLPKASVSSDDAPSQATILEALRSDPAQAGAPGVLAPTPKFYSRSSEPRNVASREATSAALAKLNKSTASVAKVVEKKETPQERLKRIMSKQLTKQIKKDTRTESEKKLEADKIRHRKLEETRRLAGRHERSRSRSPLRRRRSPSPYESRRRGYSRSPSRSPGRYKSRSRDR